MIHERAIEGDAEPAAGALAEPERMALGPGELLGPERLGEAGEARETAERSPVLERLSALARQGFLLP